MTSNLNISETDRQLNRTQIIISTLIGAGMTLISISLGFYSTMNQTFFPWEGRNFITFSVYLIYFITGAVVFIWGLVKAQRFFGKTGSPEVYSVASKPLNGPFFVMFIEGIDSRRENNNESISFVEDAFSNLVRKLEVECVTLRAAHIITKDGIRDYAFRSGQEEKNV